MTKTAEAQDTDVLEGKKTGKPQWLAVVGRNGECGDGAVKLMVGGMEEV